MVKNDGKLQALLNKFRISKGLLPLDFWAEGVNFSDIVRNNLMCTDALFECFEINNSK
jgi:hypothetical protein